MTLLILSILQLLGIIFLVLIVSTCLNEIIVLRGDTSSTLEFITRKNAEEVAKILVEKGYVLNPNKPFNKEDVKEIVKEEVIKEEVVVKKQDKVFQG